MPEKKRGKASSPAAFILYRPQSKGGKELLFYNEEAWRILCLSVPPQSDGAAPSPDVSALCIKWKKMFDKVQEVASGSGERSGPEAGIIDLIQSGRREYTITVVVLSDSFSMRKSQKQYLFTLERMGPETMNLSMIFRNLSLNKREQQIVRLLLAGSGNKEIADSLGLSLNTIKGYMKLLTRKLGVNNRAGIIAAILAANTGENRQSGNHT